MNSRTEFTKLQLASFVSQSGSHFLTIALAAFVFAGSGSITKASLVFVLSFLPSVFFSSRLGGWIDRRLSKWLLARNELLSILTSVLCGLCLAYKAPLLILGAIIGARSLLLFVARTGGSKWTKLISPPELQANRIKFFFLSFFLSTAVAGVLAGAVLSHPSVFTVIAIDVATYLISFSILLTLREIPAGSGQQSTTGGEVRLLGTLREIWSLPPIRAAFVAVCLSQALFQGAYSVLVSYLPMGKLHMGLQGIGNFQLAASVGITLGFLVVWALPNFLTRGVRTARFGIILGSGLVGLLLCIISKSTLPSLASFFLFNAAYECIWLFYSAEFFQKSPSNVLARYQFTLTASASFLMALSTVGYSLMMENFGEAGFVAVMAIALICWRILSHSSISTTESLSVVRAS
jgi:hypothetical protein